MCIYVINKVIIPRIEYWTQHIPINESTCRKWDVKIRSFWRDPQPQAERDQGDRADAAEPERGEPQQTLHQRPRIWFDLAQW